jgi:hypothetical protein
MRTVAAPAGAHVLLAASPKSFPWNVEALLKP